MSAGIILTKQATDLLVDPGTLKVKSNPTQAGVWLKLGTAPLDSFGLSSDRMHEIRVDGPDGFQSIDTQVVGAHWSGEKDRRMARITVELKAVAKDKGGKPVPTKLPAMPPKPPDATGFVTGRGPIHVEAMCVDDV